MKQVRVRVDRYFGLLFPEVFWKKKAVLPQNNYHQKNVYNCGKCVFKIKEKNIKFNTYTLEIHTSIFRIMHPKHISLYVIQNKDILIFLDPKTY